jgi:ABC-type microcin C transport system duplicated ATPase subunit YejF
VRAIRGGRISIIFQEPMTALSPLHTVGNQIGESLMLHRSSLGKAERREAGDRDAEAGRLRRSGEGLAHLPVRALGRTAPARR